MCNLRRLTFRSLLRNFIRKILVHISIWSVGCIRNVHCTHNKHFRRIDLHFKNNLDRTWKWNSAFVWRSLHSNHCAVLRTSQNVVRPVYSRKELSDWCWDLKRNEIIRSVHLEAYCYQVVATKWVPKSLVNGFQCVISKWTIILSDSLAPLWRRCLLSYLHFPSVVWNYRLPLITLHCWRIGLCNARSFE